MKIYERRERGETALSPHVHGPHCDPGLATSPRPSLLGAGISSQAPFILRHVRICETTDTVFVWLYLYSDFVSFRFVLTEQLSLGDLAVVI